MKKLAGTLLAYRAEEALKVAVVKTIAEHRQNSIPYRHLAKRKGSTIAQ